MFQAQWPHERRVKSAERNTFLVLLTIDRRCLHETTIINVSKIARSSLRKTRCYWNTATGRAQLFCSGRLSPVVTCHLLGESSRFVSRGYHSVRSNVHRLSARPATCLAQLLLWSQRCPSHYSSDEEFDCQHGHGETLQKSSVTSLSLS